MKKIFSLLMITLMFSLVLVGCTKNNSALKNLEGDYQDSFSQRAHATFTYDEDTDKLLAAISWGNSASEAGEWAMSLTLDGDKLVYTDGVQANCKYDENGNVTVDTIAENLEGYFEVTDGKILWTGSGDDYTSQVTFEKMPDME